MSTPTDCQFPFPFGCYGNLINVQKLWGNHITIDDVMLLIRPHGNAYSPVLTLVPLSLCTLVDPPGMDAILRGAGTLLIVETNGTAKVC